MRRMDAAFLNGLLRPRKRDAGSYLDAAAAMASATVLVPVGCLSSKGPSALPVGQVAGSAYWPSSLYSFCRRAISAFSSANFAATSGFAGLVGGVEEIVLLGRDPW